MPEAALDDPELALLAACARAALDPSAADGLRGRLLGELDWTRLARLTLHHRLAPLVERAFERAPAELLPADLLAALHELGAANRARVEELTAELLALLDAFEARGLPVIPYKGPALAERLHGERGLRMAGDLDLLLRPADVDAAWALLERRGYREANLASRGLRPSPAQYAAYRRYQCELLLVRPADLIAVEPHWAIVPRTMAVHLDHAAMWDRARPRLLAGRAALGLASEDLLLALSVHAAKHHWRELRWIVDVAALLRREPGLEWAVLLERARRQGCLRMLLSGLLLAERLLGARLPGPARAALEADPGCLPLVREVARHLGDLDYRPPDSGSFSLFRLRARERRRDQAEYLLRAAFTPTEEHIRLVKLPRPLLFLYTPVKLLAEASLPLRRRRAARRAARAEAAPEAPSKP